MDANLVPGFTHYTKMIVKWRWNCPVSGSHVFGCDSHYIPYSYGAKAKPFVSGFCEGNECTNDHNYGCEWD